MFLLIACQTVQSVESTAEPPKVEKVESSDLDIAMEFDPELKGKYFTIKKKIICIEKTLLHHRLQNWAKEIPAAMWYDETRGNFDPLMMLINKKTKTISVLEYIINNGESNVSKGVYACILTTGTKLSINPSAKAYGASLGLEN